MPKVLNSTETCEVRMGKEVSLTLLESTVRRLAEELEIPLEDTSGVSYVRSLEGIKGSIKLDYHQDFDGYESFGAFKDDSRFAISKIQGNYTIDLKNSGRNLFNCALKMPKTDVEKKINLRLLENDIRAELEEAHEPVILVADCDLTLVTAETVLKYLANP